MAQDSLVHGRSTHEQIRIQFSRSFSPLKEQNFASHRQELIRTQGKKSPLLS
jgi:hypothetical protein